jgi:hypothetical protein
VVEVETCPNQQSTWSPAQVSKARRREVIDLRRTKPILVTLGWATTLSGFTLGGIFEGQLLPPQPPGNLLSEVINSNPLAPVIFYVGIFTVSILAAIVLDEAGITLASFFASYGLGAILTYVVLVLPGYVGLFSLPVVLSRTAIVFTFSTSFPIPLLVELTGTLLGIWLSEQS